MWLTGRLVPDFKTIADIPRDNGEAIRKVCREFVELGRQGLLTPHPEDPGSRCEESLRIAQSGSGS